MLNRIASARETLGETLAAFVRTPGRVVQLVRYAGTSGVALVADMAVFVALTGLSVTTSVLAAALGYLTGAILHYALSVRYVYEAHRTGKSHRRLLTEFLATGLLGLVLTATIVWSATEIVGLAPVIGKIIAIGVTFIAVYVARTLVVFAIRPQAATILPDTAHPR